MPGRCALPVKSLDDALEALWQQADLFALATHWEGYGMVIAEALKRGVPVAVTDGGAAGKLVTASRAWSVRSATGSICRRHCGG